MQTLSTVIFLFSPRSQGAPKQAARDGSAVFEVCINYSKQNCEDKMLGASRIQRTESVAVVGRLNSEARDASRFTSVHLVALQTQATLVLDATADEVLSHMSRC